MDSYFFESLMHRETYGSTESINGVAIPHGNPSNVLKSSITLIKNKTKLNGMKWIDIIFIISIAQDDIMLSREIISNIFNIISEVDILKRLKASNNHIELRGILKWKITISPVSIFIDEEIQDKKDIINFIAKNAKDEAI